jgi:hypothetical protein
MTDKKPGCEIIGDHLFFLEAIKNSMIILIIQPKMFFSFQGFSKFVFWAEAEGFWHRSPIAKSGE